MNLRPVLFVALVALSACGGGSGAVNTGGTGASGGSGASSSSSSSNAPAPTVTLSASPESITVGTSSVLTWSSTNADTCTASGAWSGTKSTSGSVTVTPSATSTYTLSCTGGGWTPSQSVTITVSASTVTSASASTLGSYTVATYTSGIATGSLYNIPKIWYPTNGTAPYAAVVFIPGYGTTYTEAPYKVSINGKTVVEADIIQWANFLASHGFVVMFIDPKDLNATPNTRSLALDQAVDALAAENTRSASPLFGRLQVDKIAVMGHSYGGAGAILATGLSNSHIAAAVGLSPVSSSTNPYGADKLPTIMISAVADPYLSNFPQQYDTIPSTTTKLLANFKQNTAEWESMHAIALTPLGTHSTDREVARLALSFLEVYLHGDMRYKAFLIEDPANMANFDYINP